MRMSNKSLLILGVIFFLVSFLVIITKKDHNTFSENGISRKMVSKNFQIIDVSKDYSFIWTQNLLFTTENKLDSTLNYDYKDINQFKSIKYYNDQISSNLIQFIKNDSFFYIQEFDLYKDGTKVNNDSSLIFKAIYTSDINKVLFFGRRISNTGEVFLGFFSIFLENRSIEDVLILDKLPNMGQRETAVDFLSYLGAFSSNNKYISYTCEMRPSIFLFSDDGSFLIQIETIDHSIPPSVIKFEDKFVFKRGETKNTNAGIFISNENVCVLSYRIKSENIVLDIYSIENGKYIYSINYADSPINNRNVNGVYQVGNNILILTLNNKLFSFLVE